MRFSASDLYMTSRRVAVINASGRQGASFVRVASAVGWKVRAHMRDRVGIVAQDICSLRGVTVVEGSLSNPRTIAALFSEPVEVAFINTTHWGNEKAIGIMIVEAARRAGVQHLVYSSMPDHAVYGQGWGGLPLWVDKFAIEEYIVQQTDIPTTFVYCGIYHNNFTSLPYPLFRMELTEESGEEEFVWKAPFHPQKKLPWLDAEHDVGPVVLQIFMDGPEVWNGHRIPLAFEYLTPIEVCDAFSRALRRPVTYVCGPIDIEISIPKGYKDHLAVLQDTLGWKGAPYFGPELEPNCTIIANRLWGGSRGMEEYAREAFPVEEAANGLTWMVEGDEPDREIELDFASLTF